MKWFSRLIFVLFGIILIFLLPVVSMNNCTQDLSSTLRSLTSQADVICEAAVKQAPTHSARPPGVVVDSKFVGNRPVTGDTVNIKVRRVLKGSKEVNNTLVLIVKIPERDIVNNCVLQFGKGDKLIFFLRHTLMDDLRFEMLTPPVRPTKILTRKLRRILSRTSFIKKLKRKNRKVAEGKKLKLTCSSSHQNAKFRWLRNGKLIRKSREMSFKKKNQGKSNPKSVLRIRKLRPDHTGLYTCTIDEGGKKSSKDFNITVIGPSEVQCADQKYCFNQGECWQKLPPLDEKYCKCHMNFSGLRCESVSINSSLLRNLQSVTGRNKNLTQAVIAIGAVLAVLALGMLVAFIFLVCHQIKNRRKKQRKQTMSYHDSFIHPGNQDETYCHIPSDDVPNSDSLVLSSWVKPIDECLVANIQESMLTEPQLGSCNGGRYIPALHTTYMQFSPITTQANGTASQQYIIKPTRPRLPAVSSSAQCMDDETTVNGLDHALDTPVIYAEPNRAPHVAHNSDGSICSLSDESACDRTNALSPYYRVNEFYQPPHLKIAKPCSVICSTSCHHYLSQTLRDSEENTDAKDLLLAELHISEEDLITEKDDIKKTVGAAPKNYPNVINPECHGARLDKSGNHQDSLPENGKSTSPSHQSSCADGNEASGSADEDKSTSLLIPNAHDGPLGDIEATLLNYNNSVLNFVF